jgi:integrase
MGKDELLGIEIRRGKTQDTIRIHFTFRGVECREPLKMEPTPANLRYAARLRSEVQNAIERGSFRYTDYFPNSKRARLFGHAVSTKTVGEMLRANMMLCQRAAKNGQMSPSTVNGYRKIVDGILLPQWDKTPARALSPAELRAWITGLGTTAKTTRNILTPLRAVLDDAVNDAIIEFNPLDKIALKRLLAKSAVPSEYEVDPFDQLEIEAILAAAKDQARNLIQYAFSSGLRTSELIALEWADVDWVHGLVHVHQAVVEKTVKATTKTEAGHRNVKMLPGAFAALQNQKQHTFLAGGRVFYNPITNQPFATDKQIRESVWRPILKRAGVRYRNPYQTRHTYACTLLSRGENILWVAQQLGHVDTEMVIRTYGKKWIPDLKKQSGYEMVSDLTEFAQASPKSEA